MMDWRSSISAFVVALVILAIWSPMSRAEEYLCSPMTGRLVSVSGDPVADVLITRIWAAGSGKGSDTVKTNAQGGFSFNGVKPKRSVFSFLGGEKAVTQRFFAMLDSGEFEFLFVTSRGHKLNKESDGQPFNVVCLTGVEPELNGFHWGTCKLE